MRFWLIILSFPVFDIAWWVWAHRKLNGMPNAKRWQRLLAAFIVAQLLTLVAIFVTRFAGIYAPWPVPILGALYLWHLILLPITVIVTFGGELLASLVRLPRKLAGAASPDAGAASTAAPSRRRFLAAAAVAAPPVLTGTAVATSLFQIPRFRHRDITVNVPDLPPALDGMTIAHVADVHVGRFTPAAKLEEVVRQTNAREPDLVLMTGDLIDFALHDLPRAIDMVKRFTPRFGLVTCEGNHDLIENGREFRRATRASGVPLLVNEAATARVRGVDVQLLGLRWGTGVQGAGRAADRGDGAIATALKELLPSLRPASAGNFPILLAHHPHALDHAAAAGIPLTLSGHTHGGQLMLTPNVGFGPWMYRYWSGTYRSGDAWGVISNGVGNWFPLRISAPAEIIHLTLRRV